MQTAARALGALLAAATLLAQQRVGEAEFDQWMRELSNWGKWGKSDQRGTVNLITPARVREAAAQVKEGFAVSLSRDADLVKSAADCGFALTQRLFSAGVEWCSRPVSRGSGPIRRR